MSRHDKLDKKFTVSQAGRYLTRKSRGAKFVGRDLVYTPEFIEYVSHHTKSKDIREALRVRAEYVYNKSKPKRPAHMTSLAKIEYQAAMKEFAIHKATLSQAFYDDEISNLKLARRLASYENYRMALRDNSQYWNDRALGRLVGILGNTPEVGVKIPQAEMEQFLSFVDRFSKKYDSFYKAFQLMIDANYGSEYIVKSMQDIGNNINDMLAQGKFGTDLVAEATSALKFLERYDIV